MNEVEAYIHEQDLFKSRMIEAYNLQLIPQYFVFRPYFEWKMGLRGCDFNRSEITSMRNTATRLLNKYEEQYPNAWDNVRYVENDIYSIYEGFGKDKEIVCYLMNINEEMINLMILRVL